MVIVAPVTMAVQLVVGMHPTNVVAVMLVQLTTRVFTPGRRFVIVIGGMWKMAGAAPA
jgi:hypothetical protein